MFWVNIHEFLGGIGLRIRNGQLYFGTDLDPDQFFHFSVIDRYVL